MTAPVFVTYQDFVRREYEKKRPLYEKLGEKAPTFKAFKQNYFASYQLKGWLESMRGLSPTEKQLYSILSTYITDAKRSVSDVPSLIVWLERYFEITAPVVEGIATSRYWEKRFAA